MLVGVPRETHPGEARVAMTPAAWAPLSQAGIELVVETGAGASAGFPDEAYREKGARTGSRQDVFGADVVLQVRTLGASPDAGRADLELLREG